MYTNSEKLLALAIMLLQHQSETISELQSVLESLPASVYWKDKDGRYLGRNQYAENKMRENGYPWQSYKGLNDFDLFEDYIANEFRLNDQIVMESEQPQSHDETIVKPSGRVAINYSLKGPLRVRDRVEGIVGISFDISDLRQIEKELENTKKEKRKTTELKKKFIQNIEHDIRTPISSIMAISEDLLNNKAIEHTNSNELSSQLLDIRSASSNLLMYVNKILEFSQTSTPEYKENISTFSLKSLFEAVSASPKFSASKKNILFHSSMSEKCPKEISSDYFLIFSIISNLLSNAVKFTHKGSITFTIDYAPNTQQHGDMIITVTDTGIGIEERHIDDIFDTFFRINASNSEKYKGSGLGLSITQSALNTLNATISVASEPGKGSKFTCSIPVCVTKRRNITHNRKSWWSNYIKRCSRVLLIEDNTICMKIAKSRLEAEGFVIETAETGLIAIKQANRTYYDLILSDIGLPDIDGFEVANFIHTQSNFNQSTPIIALTSHSIGFMKDEIDQSEFKGVIVKPFNIEELKKVVLETIALV